MALSDLAVFSEYAYKAKTEVLRQKIDLFNGATAGALRLAPAAHQGDFSDEAFFAKIAGGTVRRRNAYGAGAIPEKVMKHLVDTSVKVAAGTPTMRFDPSQFLWIQQNPKVAGAAFGQQLAIDTMADMLNTGLGVLIAAMSQTAEIAYDASGEAGDAAKPSFLNLNAGQALFGDASGQISAWLMHSDSMHKLYANALTNTERLFQFSNINVMRDPFGKLLIMTDSPHLISGAGATLKAQTLGLTAGALYIGENNDFTANEEAKNGDENIIKTYQAEWSYNIGVKGYAWDKQSGGKSPTDASLMSSANWDRIATSHKDLPGVIVTTK